MIWEGEDGSVRTLSYAELDSQTCRLAGTLKRLGLGHGDAVGVFLPMVAEAVIAFMACAKIGVIVVPIFSGFGAQAVAARLTTRMRKRSLPPTSVSAGARRSRWSKLPGRLSTLPRASGTDRRAQPAWARSHAGHSWTSRLGRAGRGSRPRASYRGFRP